MTKRYYWLKLKEDFFTQKEIKKLRRIAGGDTYTIIYLKMLLKSLKNDGRLYYDGIEDNFVSELALDIDEDEENVKMTVAYLIRSGVLVQNNADEFEILTAKEMTGSEGESAQRMRRMRSKNSLSGVETSLCDGGMLLCDTNVTNSDTEKELKKDKDKEIDTVTNVTDARSAKKPEKSAYGSLENVMLTDEEYSKLKERFADADEKIEAMSLYFGSHGNAKKYKSHYATALNWARMAQERDALKAKAQPKQKTAYQMLVEMGEV